MDTGESLTINSTGSSDTGLSAKPGGKDRKSGKKRTERSSGKKVIIIRLDSPGNIEANGKHQEDVEGYTDNFQIHALNKIPTEVVCKAIFPLFLTAKMMSNGRMRILFLLLFSLSVNAQNLDHHLTLHVVPSPLGFSWESPLSLLASIQKNRLSFSPRPLGVVYTELKCGEESQLSTLYYEKLDLLSQLLMEQRGLGVLFHSFPGKFEKGDQLKEELAGYYADGKVRFVTFGLNPGQCERATKYISEYEEKNVARNWGLPHKPRQAEGGNSLSFAMSVLDVLGFQEEIFREGWLRALLIPWEKSGPPVRDEKVNILKLVGAQWANPKEQHIVLSFWDKELMHKWLKRNLKNFPQRDWGGFKGIYLDRKHFPVLKSPIWEQQEHLR